MNFVIEAMGFHHHHQGQTKSGELKYKIVTILGSKKIFE